MEDKNKKDVIVRTRLDDDEWEYLLALCEKEQCSKSELIRKLIEEEIKNG